MAGQLHPELRKADADDENSSGPLPGSAAEGMAKLLFWLRILFVMVFALLVINSVGLHRLYTFNQKMETRANQNEIRSISRLAFDAGANETGELGGFS